MDEVRYDGSRHVESGDGSVIGFRVFGEVASPEVMERLRAGADVAVLPGQGHMAMLEDPALLADALSGFAAPAGPAAGIARHRPRRVTR
ncbi:alpha/beta fold hydrolase [Actinomadura sp. 3N407]|uniref:alpha/beta fold hydrolase n=1 Tax=Actinomadura sp. 3N407 TaxID=3457423 RepID=UPI003FCC2878